MTKRASAYAQSGAKMAHGVRPRAGSVDAEGGGTVRPTLGGGCGLGAATPRMEPFR